MSRLSLLLALALPLAACESADEPAVVTDPDPGTMESVTDPGQEAGAEVARPAERLNLNTATEAEFEALVGERMAHEFDEYRPYASIRQFRREIGKYDVDEEQMAAYEEMVFVPIVPNESDEETLMQIPGVGAAQAASLVALRPFASGEDFLAAVAEATGSTPDAVAMYLAE